MCSRVKKIILSLILILSLCACSARVQEKEETTVEPQKKAEHIKSVWITYDELHALIDGKEENAFSDKIDNEFKRLKDMGFNTVTVHVRPFADAFYRSDYFPSSKYCFGKEGSDMPYDPLKIMCDTANELGINIEAWINPYRVSSENKPDKLSDKNIAKKWLKSKKTKSRVFVCDKGIYFNPASPAVTKLIVNGVGEIVKNYSVSAIHFDDYFYPVTDNTIDKKEYKKYKNKGGKLSLSDFRRKCVSDMVKSVYKAVKGANKSLKFGISPAADFKRNYNELYADTEKWISEKGYIDYICPQVYFGFRNVFMPFMFTVKKWMYITECDMFVGLPLYKAGRADKYAARDDDSIINEFKTNDNIIARQITYLSKLDTVKGIYVFSYGCLSEERCKKEVENMLKAMENY